ncbi:glutamate racemase [Methylomonas paludis]|uniref:Glutamate racemase n=1 Tax=Methylomonas paludis TaxID=1173101 RepID=A0A975ML92_9GAMM|nr:glutamate racemase [Methylomonas paludis]QWF69892.1 glutamate racemase [Methylomonas paludis]
MFDIETVSAPIGVYDSGIGGLSVLRALREKLPGESFIYVADNAYAPYGDKSPAFIESRAEQISHFLVEHGAKALVLACNTASVVAAHHLRRLHVLPIVAMEPAIKPATQITQSKVVLVMATTNTIQSQSVARLCRAYAKDVKVILQPCPGLADQVERGQFQTDLTRRLLTEFIQPGIAVGADTIVLGCTHYAFLAQEIASIAGAAVTVLEPSDAIARQLARVLPHPSKPRQPAAATTYYTSGSAVDLHAFLASIGEAAQPVYELPADSVVAL